MSVGSTRERRTDLESSDDESTHSSRRYSTSSGSGNEAASEASDPDSYQGGELEGYSTFIVANKTFAEFMEGLEEDAMEPTKVVCGHTFTLLAEYQQYKQQKEDLEEEQEALKEAIANADDYMASDNIEMRDFVLNEAITECHAIDKSDKPVFGEDLYDAAKRINIIYAWKTLEMLGQLSDLQRQIEVEEKLRSEARMLEEQVKRLCIA